MCGRHARKLARFVAANIINRATRGGQGGGGGVRGAVRICVRTGCMHIISMESGGRYLRGPRTLDSLRYGVFFFMCGGCGVLVSTSVCPASDTLLQMTARAPMANDSWPAVANHATPCIDAFCCCCCSAAMPSRNATASGLGLCWCVAAFGSRLRAIKTFIRIAPS